MNRIELSAYAKINLGLRVVDRYEDGYHEIVTIFQLISLCDTMTVKRYDSDILYFGPNVTDDPIDNLCVKAVRAFQREFGREYGAQISLNKVIPSGAGLGGGSSDAAAVLRALSKLYEIDHEDRLMKLAAGLGADVPFLLSGKSCVLGTGKGDILQESKGLSRDNYIIIIKPNFSVSTADAYTKLDSILTFCKDNVNIKIRQFSTYSGGTPTAEMSNDFEAHIFAAHPELAEMRDRLVEAGALSAGLCGSGSALFGIFESETQVRAVQNLRHSPWLSFVCRPV